MTPVIKYDGKCVKEKSSKKIIEIDLHMRLEIREGNIAPSKMLLQDYQVLGIYTKDYNNCLPCERGW